MTFEEIEELASRYIAAYIGHKIDRVDVAYMKFVSASKQAAGSRDAVAACPKSLPVAATAQGGEQRRLRVLAERRGDS